MSAVLPLHVAVIGEMIPERGNRPWDGPDMREATPIETMLEMLAPFAENEVSYLALWRQLVSSVGCSVLAHRDRNGEIGLMLGGPCDVQMRHRSRWMRFLLEHLDGIEGRRDALMRQLDHARHVVDERPRRPREATRAIRGFLRVGGRLMIRPDGRLEEGGDMSPYFHGTDDEAEAFRAANHGYFSMRHRLNADAHIRRVVRALGRRTDNGWMVLEARA